MRYLIIVLLLFIGCDEDSPTGPIHGCFDSQACNYNPSASIDDNSCEYPQGFYDCDGNCNPAQNYDCDGNCLIIGEWEMTNLYTCTTNPSWCDEDSYYWDGVCYYEHVPESGGINFYSTETYEFTSENENDALGTYTCSASQITLTYTNDFDTDIILYDLLIDENEAILSTPCDENECEFCPYDAYIVYNRIN